MHYSSSILLIGAIAPLAIATPVPHFRLPFRRSTGDVRPWDGAIERDWSGTLDLPSAEVPKKLTAESPPVVLHKNLEEANPYFSFLRKLVKRNSDHVPSLRTVDVSADSPETAKVPIPIPLATPPPGAQPPPPGPPGAAPPSPASPMKFHPEVFDPDVHTIKRAAPEPTPAPSSYDEKRQIQYAPPSWPTNFGVGGAPPTPDTTEQPFSAEEAEDERARQEGPEASQMPPGHPVPENLPSAAGDQEAASFPLIGNIKRDMMTLEDLKRKIASLNVNTAKDVEEAKVLAGKIDVLEQRQRERELRAKRGQTMSAEQLRQVVRGKMIHSAEDVEEMKKLVEEVDVAEKQEQRSAPAPEQLKLIKRNNKFAGSDIVTPEEASQAWKQTIKSSKSERGKLEIKGMETWVHENPFGKRDEHDEKMERKYGMGEEHEMGMRLKFGKRGVGASHVESSKEEMAKVPEGPPVVEVVAPAEQGIEDAADAPTIEAFADAETPDVAVKATTDTKAKANGPGSYGYGSGGYGPYYPGGQIVPGAVYTNNGPGYYPQGGGYGGYNGGRYNGGGYNGGGYNGGGFNGGGRGYGRGYKKV